MFFSQKRAGGADAKQELLERARRERDQRAAAAQHGPLALRLQALYRGRRCREAVATEHAAELTAKLQQVATLTAALKASKGIDFVPPPAVLAGLVTQAILVLRAARNVGRHAPALRQLVAWLQLHLRRADGAASLAATPAGAGQISRLLLGLCRRLLARPDPTLLDAQAQFIEFALFCASAGRDPERPELRAAGAAWRVVLTDRARFNEAVCRPLCTPAAAPDAERPFSPSEAQRRLSSRAVELAVVLADAAAEAAAAVSGAGRPSRQTSMPRPHALLLSEVLSIPYVAASVAGSAAHAALVHPRALHAIIAAYSAAPIAAINPLPSFSSSGRASKRGSGALRSGGGGASSVAGGGSSKAAGGAASAPAPASSPAMWPGGAFLLGNIVQLLCDPPPAGASGGGGEGAPSSPPAAAAALEALDPSFRAAWLALVSRLIASDLPEGSLAVTTPVLWAQSGASSTPVPMPLPLRQQLRRLSSDALARAAVRLCLSMRAAALRTERLRLPPDVDPEKGTYDDYAHEAGATAGATGLASASSAPATILRRIWETSKLALSLFSRGGAAAPAPSAPAPSAPLTRTPLPDVSASSRGAAASASSPVAAGTPFDLDAAYAFCELYAGLAAPRAPVPGALGGSLASDADPIVGRLYLLNALAFSPGHADLPLRLWSFAVECCDLPLLLQRDAYKCSVRPVGGFAVITLLACVVSHLVLVSDDYELYVEHGILPLRELRHFARLLRDILAHAEGVGIDRYKAPSDPAALLALPPTHFWPRFQAAALSALRALYERHCQRPLGPGSLWIVDPSRLEVVEAAGAAPAAGVPGGEPEPVRRVMTVMPFAVPFERRAAAYNAVREADRSANQTGMPQVRISVQRERLFETAFAALSPLRGDALRRKVYVSFVNAQGMDEAGIDAGGLFKELWTSLAAVAFDPRFGLWAATDRGELYPNPSSALFSGVPDDVAFEFIGRVLGKALYEGITVGPQFARFFLVKLLGRPSNLHHLSSLDFELYKNLMFLKQYDGDVTDLCLSFTTSRDIVGGAAGDEVELVPGGRDIPVTARNRMQYIYAVADWRLNTAVSRQSAALLRGLREVIPAGWLAPFSAPELQVLISGSRGEIDVEDLRRHTAYVGGYTSLDRVVRDFWAVVADLGHADRAALLKFVTSCERAPPLGFAQLEPRFTIQRAARGDDALPTSSTCFHTLKLPAYSRAAVLREKLLLAIRSGAGFELT